MTWVRQCMKNGPSGRVAATANMAIAEIVSCIEAAAMVEMDGALAHVEWEVEEAREFR